MSKKIINAIKSSGILGAIGSLTVLLFGGWSGTVIGWLMGTAAGFMSCQDQKVYSPKKGATIGSLAGLGLGVWLLVASVVEGVLIRPFSGQSAVALPTTLLYGICSLTIAILTATLMGALQGLPGGTPAAGNSGDVSFYSNSVSFYRHSGSDWLDCYCSTDSNLYYVGAGFEYYCGFCGFVGFGNIRHFLRSALTRRLCYLLGS